MKSVYSRYRYRRASAAQQPFFQSAGESEQATETGNSFFAPATPGVQTKLTIGQPNDKYEREADAMADRVVSQQSAGAAIGNAAPAVQAMCSDCKEEGVQRMTDEEEPAVQMMEEEEVQAKEEEEPGVQLMEEEEVQMQEEEPELQKMEEEEEVQTKPLMRKAAGGRSVGTPSLAAGLQRSKGGGRPLAPNVQAQMGQAFGRDFGGVRIHTGGSAQAMNKGLRARAFTHGSDVYFNRGEYQPDSTAGKRLLAHELTHVVQQGGGGSNISRSSSPQRIDRAIDYNVLDWSVSKRAVPTPNSTGLFMRIPRGPQIFLGALVDVEGNPTDPCSSQQVGTTQTAWGGWTIADYRGRTSADGSIRVTHRPPVPMRDPGVNGSVWYDRNIVTSPASCGSAVSLFHRDGPWHSVPKARNNGAVTGNPLNYLRRYRRALFLVTYLTTRDQSGTFRRHPLRFRYWNSIQDYSITPNYTNPRGAWTIRGGVQVNNGGGNGSGVTADAPYYTTPGTTFNDHFNNSSNWTITERR